MTFKSCLKPFIPFIIAIAAIILGTAPSLTCETIQFTQVEGNDDMILLAGALSFRARGGDENNPLLMEDIVSTAFLYAPRICQNYRSLKKDSDFKYTVDSETRTVWAFAILTPLLGGALIIKAFFAAICAGSSKGWKYMGFGFLLTSIFQGLTLLIETSSLCFDNPALQYLETTNEDLASTFPESCDWGMGFYLQIAAVVLWALAGFTTVLMKEPVVVHEYPVQNQTVTYTQKPDGTVEEAKVTIVKGATVELKMI